MKKISVLLLFSLAVSGSLQAQTTFQHFYGEADRDIPQAIIQTSDGGYAVTGNAIDAVGVDDDASLLRVDDLGNVLWYYAYGGGDSCFSY